MSGLFATSASAAASPPEAVNAERDPAANLPWLLAGFICWSIGYNLGSPFLTLWAIQLGANGPELGTVAGAAYAGVAIVGVVSGPLSDRVSRRAVLLAAWGLSAIGGLGIALAPAWPLLIPFGALAMGAAGVLPALNALLAESVKPGRRTRAFHVVYAGGPIGLLIGAPVGAFLIDRAGFTWAYLAAAICLALAAFSLFHVREQRLLLSPSPATSGPRRLSLLPIGQAIAAAGVFFVLALPASYMVPYLVEVAGWSVFGTGLFNAGIAVSQLAWSAVLAGLVASQEFVQLRLGPFGRLLLPHSVVAGLVICLLANGVFGVLFPAGTVLLVLIATIGRGSYFSLQPLGSALIGESESQDRLGARFTLLGLAVAIGLAGSAVAGGWLYHLEPAAPFWVTAGGSLAGATVLLISLLVLPRVQLHSTHRLVPGS
jgi:MFS family permease